VGSGTHGMIGASYIVPPMFVEAGYTFAMAEKFKRALTKPIMIAGRVNQPQDAELAIANNQTDMVGLVRALIADPEFVSKTEAGALDDIRACIACNQACIGHRHAGYGVSCIQYPETGREAEYGLKKRALSPRKVLVVGGGPGGMKAAAVAAERGHDVTLCEKAPMLGGQAVLAQNLPGRAEFGGIITNLKREMERHGVQLQLNTTVGDAFVKQFQPEAVVVATGAKPQQSDWDIDPGAQVVDAWDVISGEAQTGSSVVIYDWRCDWVGLGVAELLAQNGCSVKLCVNGEMAGQALQSFVRQHWAGRLHSLGVKVEPYLRLYGADQEAVYFQHVMTEEAVIFENVDTLVTAGSRVQVGCQFEGVQDVFHVGDCVSPRTAEEAVLEGLRAGCEV
ncbi:MAG: FAD-dependent oxidoreductase, partial [Pseudomonadales bacterium]